MTTRVDRGRWFITKHRPAFRFSKGVLDEEGHPASDGWRAVMDGF